MSDPADILIPQVFANTRTVSVLSAKDDPYEAAFYVPAYLSGRGIDCIAVNPKLAGRIVFRNPGVASLADLPGPVDCIEIFRRPDLLPGHAEEIAALPWRPRYVWFQLGIRNDAAASRLEALGIQVVQDRCMMPEHRRLHVS
jgi:predicted CoA-binding protein